MRPTAGASLRRGSRFPCRFARLPPGNSKPAPGIALADGSGTGDTSHPITSIDSRVLLRNRQHFARAGGGVHQADAHVVFPVACLAPVALLDIPAVNWKLNAGAAVASGWRPRRVRMPSIGTSCRMRGVPGLQEGGAPNEKSRESIDSRLFVWTLEGPVSGRVVPTEGLEPPHLAAHGPEPCASTNSATWAASQLLHHNLLHHKHRLQLLL